MAQHLLHLADAGAPLEQVGGERVAEGVGADVLRDAGAARRLPDDGEEHHARQPRAPVVEEDGVVAGAYFAPLFEVALDFVARHAADGDQPLLVALADDADVALAEKEVAHPQRGELRGAQSARVEHLEHGAVAQPLGRARVNGGDDAVNLLGREDVGQLPPEFGGVDELGGRRLDFVADEQVVEEALHAAERPGLRGLFAAAFVEPAHVAFDHLRFDLARGDVVLPQDEVRELPEVAHVGGDGVLRQPFFEPDVDAVTPCLLLPFFRIFCHLTGRVSEDYP